MDIKYIYKFGWFLYVIEYELIFFGFIIKDLISNIIIIILLYLILWFSYFNNLLL